MLSIVLMCFLFHIDHQQEFQHNSKTSFKLPPIFGPSQARGELVEQSQTGCYIWIQNISLKYGVNMSSFMKTILTWNKCDVLCRTVSIPTSSGGEEACSGIRHQHRAIRDRSFQTKESQWSKWILYILIVPVQMNMIFWNVKCLPLENCVDLVFQLSVQHLYFLTSLFLSQFLEREKRKEALCPQRQHPSQEKSASLKRELKATK